MDEDHQIKYVCGPVALKFHADKASRAKLLIGPFGTGKTSSAAYDQIMCASKRVLPFPDGIRRSRFAVVRNTYPQLRDTTIKTYCDWFPPLVFGQYIESKKTYTLKIEDREIEIIFKALDTDADVRDLLSLELTGAEIDEAREIKQDLFKGLLGRVGRYPSMKDFNGESPFLSPPQITLTTNYPNRKHWLYRDFVGNPVEGYQIYEQGQSENAHNLRPGYYEDLEKDYADRPDLLSTLVRGQWGITVKGKKVYNDFVRAVHVADKPLLPFILLGLENGGQVVRGWDNTGLHPACVLTYINSIGQWYVFKEFWGDEITCVAFAEEVLNWCKQTLPYKTTYRDIADPAGKYRDSMKKSPAQYVFEECGLRLEDGIQTFKVRVGSVNRLLNRMVHGQPAIVIDPGCDLLIDGFEGGYHYAEIGSSGIYRDEPFKDMYADVSDALQYIATRLFGAANEEEDEEYYGNRPEGRSKAGGY